MPTVRIDVTPVFQQGNELFCAIDPPGANQQGGMIRLNRGTATTLRFDLQPHPNFPNLRFDPPNDGSNSGSEAFWCDANDCPTHSLMDPQYQNPQLSNGGARLEVDAAPGAAGPSGVHYRLNFDNGCHFDPIIIHT